MPVDTWDPNIAAQNSSYELDPQWVEHILHLAQAPEADKVKEQLSSQEIQQHSPMMKLDQGVWTEQASRFSETAIIDLIKWLTLAEMQIPQWSAGPQSPVIWLTKLLRKRGTPIEKNLLLWIKANSDNKFLPNGPL